MATCEFSTPTKSDTVILPSKAERRERRTAAGEDQSLTLPSSLSASGSVNRIKKAEPNPMKIMATMKRKKRTYRIVGVQRRGTSQRRGTGWYV